jgi:hypothetical protein
MWPKRRVGHGKVIIQVEGLDTGFERFKQAWETGEYQGEYILWVTGGSAQGAD